DATPGRSVDHRLIEVDGIPLTATRIRLLLELFDGKTRAQAGKAMGLRVRTVDFHLDKMKTATGLPNLPLLMRWAGERHDTLARLAVAAEEISGNAHDPVEAERKVL